MSLVQLSEHERQEYLLLQPVVRPARTGTNFQLVHPIESLQDILSSIRESRIVAVDFETRGGDYSADMQAIGIGFAWDEGNCYFDIGSLSNRDKQAIVAALNNHQGLIAHNVYFDGGVAKQCLGVSPKWKYCTYSLYSYLANEGYAGRSWGLKVAQVELLGWKDSNEHELDDWLIVNGYYIGNRRVDHSPEYLRTQFREGKIRPDKSAMWNAPAHILGKYCCLDAESTYLLYMEVLELALRRFPDLDRFICDHWMGLIDTLIDQKIYGIEMDRPGLIERKNTLLAQIASLDVQFERMPEVYPHVLAMEQEYKQEHLAKEPARIKKDGGISKNWEKWNARLALIDNRQDPEYRFNMQSTMQLRELLYNRLGNEPRIFSDKGEPSTSIKALQPMGAVGKLLTERAWLVKELGYIEKYLELTETRPTIHPSFRTPGTTTGRLSSKEPNLQQVPKSKAVMSLFRARPGKVWVDLDFSALEPVVATEYSQDENMMQIYGDGRPANDIYCFVMAHIPGMEERARALGYDPYNPTKESLARVKKEMKKERGICKTVVLACQYGAGVRKVHQTLEEQEIHLSFDEVETIHSGYWNLFSQVKDFARSLQYERKRHKGYILNGMGRPMAIPDEFEKDILNRFIQSTGHDVLTVYITLLKRNLDAAGIQWNPIIIDFHDATTVEVNERDGERTLGIFNKAMHDLNNMLQGTIKLKGVPVIGRNLAEVKEPEE
jgi:DNA polymerase I-like protein with 3'-5' exonuclease and polymerase domains